MRILLVASRGAAHRVTMAGVDAKESDFMNDAEKKAVTVIPAKVTPW